jgi:hypothetical protein
MYCKECRFWIVKRVTEYDNGAEIVNYSAPEGSGYCSQLNQEFVGDFGCLKFEAGEHVETTKKTGMPWQHWVIVVCPKCKGNPAEHGDRRCHCSGTGKVRLYDDGFVGEEQVRRHPAEPQMSPGEVGRLARYLTDSDQTQFLPVLQLPKNRDVGVPDAGTTLAPKKPSGMEGVMVGEQGLP